jgi:hypothetical protein
MCLPGDQTKMKKKRYLTKEQRKLIDGLFTSDVNESEVLKKHGVTTTTYRRWLKEKVFADELKFRIASGRRQSEFTIAKYAPAAAAKIAALTKGQKEDVARKTCLDIITLPTGINQPKQEGLACKDELDAGTNLDPALASKLLDVLSQEKKQ